MATYAGAERLSQEPIRIVFAELHKYKGWKQFLKGFFDTYEARFRIIVTGSLRLDVYRKGGDSLMARLLAESSGGIDDPGSRAETFCACHLLKAVEAWTDLGMGRFELRYIRDLQKREVDFAILREGQPWFLVEAKSKDTALSKSLAYFQKETGAAHAFQVSIQADYVPADCFARREPTIVPARTFSSQLF